MRTRTVSRRTVLGAGVCALTATAAIPPIESARAEAVLNPHNDDTIRKYYAAWEKKDWRPFDALLTDDFTFTSANNDDHISRALSKRNAGSHGEILSSGLTCSGYSDVATRRL